MTITVNGKPMDVPNGSTVRSLLELLGLGSHPAAVELNRAIVPKRRHGDAVLAEGDMVEVVTLVGGG